MKHWRIVDQEGNPIAGGETFTKREYAMAALFLWHANNFEYEVEEVDGMEVTS